MDTTIVHENGRARNRYPDVYTDSRGRTWYYCSTARRYFQPTDAPLQGTHGCVWIHCTYCDVDRNIKGRSVDYDPFQPQPHAYRVEAR